MRALPLVLAAALAVPAIAQQKKPPAKKPSAVKPASHSKASPEQIRKFNELAKKRQDKR